LVEDKLTARVSGRFEHKGGQYTNLADGTKLGERETSTVTAQLAATPTDALTLKSFFGYFKYDDGPDARGLFLIPQRPCAVAGTVKTWFCGALPNFPLNQLGFNTNVDQRYRDNVFPRSLFGTPLRDSGGATNIGYQAHGSAEYKLENGMTLNAIGAWHSSKASLISDEDARDTLNFPNSAANIARGARTYANEETLIDRYSKDWSIEARLTSAQTSKFRYTAGASLVHADSVTSWVTGDGITGVRTTPSATARALVSTPALFGGAYYDLTSTITISAEGRYQWDRVSSIPFIITGTPFSFSYGAPLTNTFKSFAPRVTLDYKPNADNTFFVLFSRGYRPGSFNSSFLTLPAAQVAQVKATINADLFVRQEHLDNYEIGWKSRFWDGRAQAAVSAYSGKIYDLQQTTSVPTVDPSGVATVLGATANLGQLEFHGIELEGQVQATRELNFDGSFSWNHTDFEKGVCPQCAAIAGFDNIVGRHLMYAPEFKGSLVTSYTRPVTDTYDSVTRIEAIYEGKKYADPANFAWVRPRALVNFRTALQSKALRVEFYVTNLFDNKTASSAGNSSYDRLTQLGVLNTTIVTQLADRRTWGLRTSYNF
jgi:iron complex outermembrane receptor protein